jgi:uncharacterized protein YaiE (UPF0345 family)
MTKISNQYSLTNILTADLANSRLGINNVSPTVALDVTGAARVTTSAYFATASGSVGIGTTSPSGELHVKAISGFSELYIQGSSSTSGMYLFDQNTESGLWKVDSGYMAFGTTNAERMRITSAGYLLLGTTSSYWGQAGRGNFEMNGSTDNMFAQKVGDVLMNYIYSSTSQTEIYSLNKLRLSGGNVLLNTTTDNGERLYVNGAIRATGTITANSDITLKKNLLKIENALEKVEQINGYTYELKEDDSKRYAGVIAQEIQEVLPEIVNKGNDGILGVEYGNISALLIEAIKELSAENTSLINRIEALENK